MASIGMGSLGYYIDTTAIHRPIDVFGICNPPATLQNVGATYGIGGHVACLTSSVQTIQVNGQPQVVTVQVPAGTYQYINGSKAQP